MPTSENKVWVLIPASGVGSRMRSDIPKQYLPIDGVTILEHTVRCFTSLPNIAGILVVISPNDTYWGTLFKQADFRRSRLPIKFTYGGEDRATTVFNGLRYLLSEEYLSPLHWVMVHDAARPCVSKKDLLSLLKARNASKYDGAILACPVKDTMKRSKDSVSNTVDYTESRENLWHALTPQLFRLEALWKALEKANAADYVVTDEASAMEFSNKTVQLIEGSSDNIKLTSPSDLGLVEFLLKNK